MSRPRPGDLALLALGVVAISAAAPITAQLAIGALAIAFWRNLISTAALAPAAAARRRGELVALRGDQRLAIMAAGLALAVHFGCFIAALQMTSVAAATALVSLQVIWIVGFDLLRGIPVPGRVVAGVVVATAGAIVVSGVDVSVSGRALAGDALALAGSLAIAVYAVLGSRIRREVSTLGYTVLCYGVAALALGPIALASGEALAGFSAQTWGWLLALTATAQLLGHSVFNHVLATVSPTVVGLALLLEIPGAALIAGLWLEQVPGIGLLAGVALILGGMAVVVGAGGGQATSPDPVPPG